MVNRATARGGLENQKPYETPPPKRRGKAAKPTNPPTRFPPWLAHTHAHIHTVTSGAAHLMAIVRRRVGKEAHNAPPTPKNPLHTAIPVQCSGFFSSTHARRKSPEEKEEKRGSDRWEDRFFFSLALVRECVCFVLFFCFLLLLFKHDPSFLNEQPLERVRSSGIR